MNFVFDTNAILIYLKNDKSKDLIESRCRPFEKGNILILSVVTLAELRSIAKRNNWGKRRIDRIEELLDSFVIVEIRYNELIEAYAKIDAYSQGKDSENPLPYSARNMGKNDLWIAATAHVSNSTLITTDKDFIHLHDIFLDLALIELDH